MINLNQTLRLLNPETTVYSAAYTDGAVTCSSCGVLVDGLPAPQRAHAEYHGRLGELLDYATAATVPPASGGPVQCQCGNHEAEAETSPLTLVPAPDAMVDGPPPGCVIITLYGPPDQVRPAADALGILLPLSPVAPPTRDTTHPVQEERVYAVMVDHMRTAANRYTVAGA
jgi:hypothetical protein